jgi:hypothetical protein
MAVSNRPPLFWILMVLGVVFILYGVEHQLTHMYHVSKTVFIAGAAGAALIFWATRLGSAKGEGE